MKRFDGSGERERGMESGNGGDGNEMGTVTEGEGKK